MITHRDVRDVPGHIARRGRRMEWAREIFAIPVASVDIRVDLRADPRRWDRKLFPDHVGFLKGLHDKNLKTTLNTHPADGVRAFEEQYPAMCKALGRDASTKLVSAIGPYNTVPVPYHPRIWDSTWTLPTPPSEPLPCPSTAFVDSPGTSRSGLLPGQLKPLGLVWNLPTRRV
jgi:hypothetical protein